MNLDGIYEAKRGTEERREVHKEIRRILTLFRSKNPKTSKKVIDEKIELMKEILERTGNESDVNKLYPRDIITTNNKLKGINAGIINTDTAISCVHRLNGNCSLCKICYSLNHERRFYHVLIHHIKQAVYFHDRSVEDMARDICYSGFNYIRWNEAGDLEDDCQVEKINKVIELVHKERPDIGFQTYTKSYDLGDKLNEVSVVNSMKKRGSKSYISVSKTLYDKENHKFKDGGEYELNKLEFCFGKCEECGNCFDMKNNHHIVGLFH